MGGWPGVLFDVRSGGLLCGCVVVVVVPVLDVVKSTARHNGLIGMWVCIVSDGVRLRSLWCGCFCWVGRG